MKTLKTLSVILLLLAPAACKRQKVAEDRLDTFPVRITPAARRDIEETIVLVGSIKAKDEAALFSRVPGKLQRNVLKEGDPVRKGAAVALVERDEVGVRFEPAPVPSTLDGVVARLYLDQGQNVTPTTPVALVVDPSQILARVDVPERFAGRVRLGLSLRVKVDAYPDRAFHGSVTRVSPVVDPTTRSTLVEARIDDAGSMLRPGMFGEIALVLARTAGALAVPAESVTDGSGASIFIVKDGKAVKREVTLGVKSDAFVEVVKGLAPGEQVVTFGLFGLKDGSPVEILAPEAAATEPAR